MIAIANYGMGNIRSVFKAFEHIGADVKITNAPSEIKDASALIVPGVGAFGDCIKNLKENGLFEAIKDFIVTKKPFLGLCLGLHILFENSEEAPDIKGLGIFKGTVKKFPKSLNLKIPHMGWNEIKINKSNKSISNGIFNGIPDNSYTYFVHSYYVEPQDKSIIATETEYGLNFCSSITKDNVIATQFHPEKSQEIGLNILRNFIKLCK